jgi:hypothetical protein
MISIFSAIMAAVVVALVVLKGLLGQGPKAQRIALCMIGAGIVWAGPTRFLGMSPGLGDLLLVSGIAAHIIALHGSRKDSA